MNTVKFYRKRGERDFEIIAVRCWQPKPCHYLGRRKEFAPSPTPTVLQATKELQRQGWTRVRPW